MISNMIDSNKILGLIRSFLKISGFSFSILLFCIQTIFSYPADDFYFNANMLTQIGTPKYMNKKRISDGTQFDSKDKRGLFFDKNRINSDSVKREDRIISIADNGEQFTVKIEVVNYDQEIKLGVFNLLGKQVLEIYRGYPHKDIDYPYSFYSNNLPNGVYFCVLQGRNFRKAKKFIVTR